MLYYMTEEISDRTRDLMADLVMAKKKKNEAERAIKAVSEDLIRSIESMEEMSVVGDVGPNKYRATIVNVDRFSYNEAGIREAIGEESWEKVTDRKINTSKFEESVIQGLMDRKTLLKNVQKKTSKPYVKLTQL